METFKDYMIYNMMILFFRGGGNPSLFLKNRKYKVWYYNLKSMRREVGCVRGVGLMLTSWFTMEGLAWYAKRYIVMSNRILWSSKCKKMLIKAENTPNETNVVFFLSSWDPTEYLSLFSIFFFPNWGLDDIFYCLGRWHHEIGHKFGSLLLTPGRQHAPRQPVVLANVSSRRRFTRNVLIYWGWIGNARRISQHLFFYLWCAFRFARWDRYASFSSHDRIFCR